MDLQISTTESRLPAGPGQVPVIPKPAGSRFGGLYFMAGGGTGGHLFPGLTLAAALSALSPEVRVVFAGSGRPLECELVASHGYEHRVLPVEPSPVARRNPLKFLWRNWRAYRIARNWLNRERPVAVIGLGGFASFPLVMAACRLRIPTMLLEQNLLPGRATRWLSRSSQLVCLSFPESVRHVSSRIQTCITGNPVRTEIARLAAEFDGDKTSSPPTLLILGGSQGASTLNLAVLRMIEHNRERFSGWRIVHQTGAAQTEEVRARYRALNLDHLVQPFFSDLAAHYRQAALVISRAGATTLAELACAGLPSVLVPYPHAAANHQQLNGEAFEAAGAALVVLEANPSGQAGRSSDSESLAMRLSESVLALIAEPQRLRGMRIAAHRLARPEATKSVIEALATITQHTSRGICPRINP